MDTPPPPPPPPPVTPPPTPGQPAGAPPPIPPRRNWWQRNWKWFVPLGCLTFIVAGVLFIVAIVAIVFGAMKSSEPYKYAMARAQADARVQEALGSPVHSGFFVTGSTNVNGGSGKADLSIPVSGPKGSGTIYVMAEKSAGEWEYSKLTLQVEGGDAIDLNTEPNE